MNTHIAPRIIVVGSVNVDLTIHLPTLPRAGQTVTGGTFRQAGGGKGANQAVAAARLGGAVTFIGAVGDDDHGTLARADLAAAGVHVGTLTTIGGTATGVASVLVDHAGENLIGVASGANHHVTAAQVTAAFDTLPDGAAVVLANLEIPMEAVEAAARYAAERGWPFLLNPAPARPLPPTLLARTTVLTPNTVEVTQLGVPGPDALLEAGVRAVVVTRGADGADIHLPAQPLHHLPAFRVPTVDTTGAGDCFNGALAWGLASGHPLRDAVTTATAAAAMSTTHMGARGAIPDAATLRQFLDNADPGHLQAA